MIRDNRIKNVKIDINKINTIDILDNQIIYKLDDCNYYPNFYNLYQYKKYKN
jgi:hypothetical protein